MASTLGERRAFYAAIVSTALEGGVGYWSAAEGYRWFDPELSGGTAAPGPQGTANAWAILVPADEEASFADWPHTGPDGRGRAEVTVESVTRAVGRIVRGQLGHHLRENIVADIRHGVREWDASYIDADAADVIVQVAVFGEVVFS